ncbi:MAG TPA: diacylglycerol kinase family protein, partial [Rudaea sp.]|nr:diacylglycerol kinase family protein [Rudaea sp.]
MRKALLLYNPHSGRQRARREADVELAVSEMRAAGVDAVAEPTRAAGSAGEQARAAAGFDTIIACGGDGTVHDVLQGVAGTPLQLAVLPLGTGNALANDLGIARDVRTAVRMLLDAAAQPISIGRVTTTRNGAPETRSFMIGVGVGADAHMVYRLSAAFKRRFGMIAYYTESTRQWATHSFPEFEVEYRDLETGETRRGPATQVLAIRITYFGGMLRRLAPGAALQRNDLRLVIFRTRSRLRYLRYMWNVLCDREQ